MKNEAIKADLVVSKIPTLEDYSIGLNTSFTLERLADANNQINYAPWREYNVGSI